MPNSNETSQTTEDKEKLVEEGVVCPDCGAELCHTEGCVLCPFCGWSKCG